MNEINPYLKELLVPGKMVFWVRSLDTGFLLVLTAHEENVMEEDSWFNVEGLVFSAKKTFKKVLNIHSTSSMNDTPWLYFIEVKR